MAAVMVAFEALLAAAVWFSERSFDDPLVLAFKAMLLWWAISAAAQRLHDLGRSAWWMLWTALAVIAWAFAVALAVVLHYPPEQMAPGEAGYLVVLACIAAPLLAALLWLHFARGQTQDNKHGPVPAGWGFARRPHVSIIGLPILQASRA